MNKLINLLIKNPFYVIQITLAAYWIALFIGTSLPSPSVPGFGIHDKILHFGAFFGLTVLLRTNFLSRTNLKENLLRKDIYTLTICLVYALFDEIHQMFIPGRSCDPYDLIADFAGTLMGLLFFRLLYQKLINKISISDLGTHN